MPRLWHDTIEAHRRAVRDATLDTAAALVARHGLAFVSMSQIAEHTGIGRATLYKYFPDVEAILLAWHERQITRHLNQLVEVRDRFDDPAERLHAVLAAYAQIAHVSRGHGDSALAALLHQDKHIARAQRQLTALIHDLLVPAVAAGVVRADVAPQELAHFCVHALTAAGGLASRAAVRRLLAVTMAGLRPAT